MPKFPISFFGPIEYFKAVSNFENIEFEIHETYKKQSLRNRYKIGTSNGTLELTIPITKPNGSKTLTKDIIIDESQNWKINHWRSIVSAYMHTPYFEHYESDIYNLIFSDENRLLEKDLACFDFINKTFDLGVSYSKTSEFDNYQPFKDFINVDFHLNNSNEQYIQPFSNKFGFSPNLSILDLLFCEGPLGRFFLKES